MYYIHIYSNLIWLNKQQDKLHILIVKVGSNLIVELIELKIMIYTLYSDQ